MDESTHTIKSPKSVILLVALSFLVFIAIFVFIYQNNSQSLEELDELVQASVIGSEKMLLISRFSELARNRSRDTLQILEADDVFYQDELNQRIENYASQFAEVRVALDTMIFSPEDFALYRSALDLVPTVLPAQRQAVELLMHDGDKEQARQLIFETVLPGQQKIIEIFSELQLREHEDIKKTAKLIENSISVKHQRNTYLYGAVFLLLSISSLVVVAVLFKDQRIIHDAYEDLEIKVEERTFELKEARDAALAASRAKSEFLNSMSHELRTPLNAVIGFSQLLEINGRLAGEDLDSIQEIHRAGTHLLELINEVLDLARIESGKMQVHQEPIVIDDVVNSSISIVRSLAEKKQVVIRYENTSDVMALADFTRLKQLLINLLSNAVKYNRVSGTVDLRVTDADEQGFVRFNVQDTGKGISAERIEMVFEPFNRLGEENGAIEGTGIGLTISRRIAELMNGKIGVRSEVDVGSHFWIDIPVFDEHPSA